jgi:ABC-2 type transport system permease protein
MYITVYPAVAEEMAGLASLDLYRLLGIDLASFAGYIASVVVQILPLILGVYVITLSTGTLAGEEEAGTLEPIVAMPMRRWQVVTMKAAAHALILLLILVIAAFGAAIALVVVSQTTEVDVAPMQLFVALIAAWPLMLAFYAIGLFLGAIMPTRRLAEVALVLLYIASYMANSLAALADPLAFLKTFSLFAYINTTASVFEDGIDPFHTFILLAIALGFFLLALWAFAGRNLTAGQWIWQRRGQPAAAPGGAAR